MASQLINIMLIECIIAAGILIPSLLLRLSEQKRLMDRLRKTAYLDHPREDKHKETEAKIVPV